MYYLLYHLNTGTIFVGLLQSQFAKNQSSFLQCWNKFIFKFQAQTKSTLDFAQRAKKIVQHAHVNEILDERALMNRQRKEIADLKIQLEQMQKSGLNEPNSELLTELETQKQKNAELLKKLQDQFLSSTIAGN